MRRLLSALADRLLGTPRPVSARVQIDLQAASGRPGKVYRSARRINRRLDRDGLRGLDEQ